MGDISHYNPSCSFIRKKQVGPLNFIHHSFGRHSDFRNFINMKLVHFKINEIELERESRNLVLTLHLAVLGFKVLVA